MDVRSLTIGDLNRIARERGQRGKVATASGLIDHRKASLVGRAGSGKQQWRELPAPTEEQMRAELSADLPPVVRRSARERYLVLLNRLADEAQKSYKQFGYVKWPDSLQNELKVMGWRAGDPDLAGQVEALARRMFEKAHHQQRDSDRSKAALDWHGHSNTAIEISTAPKGGAKQKGK